ncbi:MAG: ThiF family adenylyltransferase [Oscillospiraceae bacterium]
MADTVNEAFLRTQMLLGADAMARLRRCHVIVFGLGGVGSYAAECLARSGVGELTLVDQDTISVTNINRQLYALRSTVGQSKAEVAARRCADIDPELRVHPICATYDAAHRDRFFSTHYDYIADAIDLVSCKLDLIEQARLRRIPILTALGTGNKLDPTLLQVTDISKTSGCPLARVMRRELRARDIRRLKVVYSPEEPAETQQLEAPPPGRRSVPASVAWVPATAGLLMGSVVIRDLLHGGGMIP